MPPASHPSVLLIAGDVSGDTYTARLARAISLRHPDWSLHALGGRQLGAAIAETGGTWIGDTTNCSAIGILSVLKLVVRGAWLAQRLRRFVRSHRVNAVVLCDWGGFNCGHLEFFKKLGIPVLYYFPPRSWQRTGLAGLNIAPRVTRVATPFEWSARRLSAAGCNAEWVGHPLLENLRRDDDRSELRREFGATDEDKLIALLPGSRVSELKVLAPRMAAAAEILRLRHSAKFVAAVPEPLLANARRFFPASVKIVGGRAADALLASDAAIVKTGTATLEAAVIGVPQVTVYDFAWLARIEWLLLWTWKRIPFIALPNIILQRMAVPELLGLDCRPEAIAFAISDLLENELERHRMETDYKEIRHQLGQTLAVSATERTAEILDEMIGADACAFDSAAQAAR